jgi:hypothetical protein
MVVMSPLVMPVPPIYWRLRLLLGEGSGIGKDLSEGNGCGNCRGKGDGGGDCCVARAMTLTTMVATVAVAVTLVAAAAMETATGTEIAGNARNDR